MKSFKKHTIAVLTAILAISSVQCSSLNLGGLNMYSTKDDAQLGSNLSAEIKKDSKTYPILNNEQVRSYVQGIVNDILKSPEIKFKGIFPYSVQIIHDDKTVNAFCTPGGYIYVYTGLIKFLDNEASLAGVLGHEIAHAERRHSTQRLTTAQGTQALTGLALGNSANDNEKMAANLFSGLYLLKNSRSDEAEADDYSFKYLKTSKWYPGALLYFFDKIDQGKSSNTEFFDRLLSTHPLSKDRYDAMQARIKAAKIPPATDNNLLSAPYQKAKKLLP